MSMKSLYLPAALCAIALPLIEISAAQETNTPTASSLPGLAEFPEPSGICHHPGRGTLFVVGDRGHIGEFKPDGTMIRQERVRKADFEGITHDPQSGRLYIAIEGAEAILEVDPDSLFPLREFKIERSFRGADLLKKGGDGIEAITFAADASHPHGGTFYIANQGKRLTAEEDISAIFEVEVPLNGHGEDTTATVIRHFAIGAIDMAGLHYNPATGNLLVVSDTMNRWFLVTTEGNLLQSGALPGVDQEGIAIDAEGFWYIAQDSGDVLKWRDPSIENETPTP